MDPARVEGLAKVLADTARTRQVIVFTHDDRLPEAVRRLGIPATVLSVTRRAHQVWTALSRASHVHPYDLSPTRGELLTWIATVQDVVEATERGWRK